MRERERKKDIDCASDEVKTHRKKTMRDQQSMTLKLPLPLLSSQHSQHADKHGTHTNIHIFVVKINTTQIL